MFPGNKAQKRRYGTPLQMSSLFAGSPGQTGSRSVFAPKRDYRNNANRFSLPTSRSRDVNGVTEIKEREREFFCRFPPARFLTRRRDVGASFASIVPAFRAIYHKIDDRFSADFANWQLLFRAFDRAELLI